MKVVLRCKNSFIHSFIFAMYTKYYNGAGLLCLVKCDEGRKVDFQVLCLQVGGSRKISEVQVRVCYYWQRLFSFT